MAFILAGLLTTFQKSSGDFWGLLLLPSGTALAIRFEVTVPTRVDENKLSKAGT
jgi:hypothetical protein